MKNPDVVRSLDLANWNYPLIIQFQKNDKLLIIQSPSNKCIDQMHLKLSDFVDFGVIKRRFLRALK